MGYVDVTGLPDLSLAIIDPGCMLYWILDPPSGSCAITVSTRVPIDTAGIWEDREQCCKYIP